MASQYRKIWESDDYTTGIYDNCDAALFVRKDGKRARIEMDGVKWQGNTGGYHRYKTYIEGREQVKATVKALRCAQIDALKMGMSRNNYYVIDQVVGPY